MHDHTSNADKVRFSILTCSNTRTPEDDESGDILHRILADSGYKSVEKRIVKDDSVAIVEKVRSMIQTCDILLITGGTGITQYDVTIEAVRSISQKEMTGFMVQFQILSYKEVGTAAMLSRASAFIVDRKMVFCLPGSPEAASLGLKGLILPEVGHLIHEMNR